jgi:drug/metabolite transporter (DMT)-like permease
LAFTTMAWAQQYTSATRAALIFALEPVVAWLTSFVINGERLAGRAVFGAFLILTGIVMVELKRTDVRKHHKERVADPDV